MNSEPIYLIVARDHVGRETIAIYRDVLPSSLKRKPSPIIYALRLDRLTDEHRDFWLSKSTSELMDVYRWLRDEGTLPSTNLTDAAKSTEPRARKLGDWWTQPKVPWDQSAPPNPNYEEMKETEQ